MLNLAEPLSQLGLRPRTLRMLQSAGIGTAADLLKCTEADLCSHTVDDRAIVDVIENLAMHALSLKAIEVVSKVAPVPITAHKGNEAEFAAQEAALFSEPIQTVEGADADDFLDSGVGDDDLQHLQRVFAGIELRKKRAAKTSTLTDDRRANAFAERLSGDERRKTARPVRDDSRVTELRETVTLTVDDVAFLYNVSRDAIYDSLKRTGSSIPHTRVGKRIVIPTRHVFQALGLE